MILSLALIPNRRALFPTLVGVLFFGFTALCFGEENSPVENGAQLVLSSEEIEPTTTFELRFDEPIVAPDQVGFVAKDSPLAITPTLSGSFEWLSQRSGVFTPSAPPALGTTYHISLAPGLRKADGTPLVALLSRTLETPPMEVMGTSPESGDDDVWPDDAPSNPKFCVQFNVDVTADAAEKFVVFRNAKKEEVSALVSQAVPESDSGYEFRKLRSWRQRFDEAHGQGKPKSADKDEDDSDENANKNDSKKEPLPSRLLIMPSRPLPVGKGWRLIIGKDLPASDGAAKLPKEFVIKIGDVQPFKLKEAEMRNSLDNGRSITLIFSKTISPEVTVENVADWVDVSPEPPELGIAVDGNEIDLFGKFDLEKHYTVRVKPGLHAEEPFALEQTVTKKVAFTPLPSRLYFPAFSTAQLSGGQREFQLRTVNTNRVRVRAKTLSRDTLIYALNGYKSYTKKWNDPGRENEPYREVNFVGVPGPIVYDKTFDTAPGIDATQTLTLRWDDILGKNKTGAVFLAAERATNNGERSALGTQSFVQLTDIGLAWKQDRDDKAWVYAFSHASGQQLANTTLRALTDDNITLLTQTTDADGLARFQIPLKTRWLLAENGEDLHAVRFHPAIHRYDPNEGYLGDLFLPLWHFHLPLYGNDRERREVLLFSERPVYQPGETLHFKAIVREQAGEDLAMPGALGGHVDFYDAKDQKFLTKNFTLSPLGSMSDSIALPAGPLGGYRAQLYFNDQPNNPRSFEWRVEQYKPNAFEISVGAKDSYAANEKIELPVSARYFFGKPLSEAKVHWSLKATDEPFEPKNLKGFTFFSEPVTSDAEERGATAFHLQGEASLDEKGAALLKPEITIDPNNPQPRRADLLVEITDVDQQTISESANFTKQSSGFYLGLKTFDEVIVAGSATPVTLVAMNADGTPHEPQITATVRVQQINWHVIREEGAGGALTYHSEPELTKVFESNIATRPLVKFGEKWELAPDGDNNAPLNISEPGEYYLEAFAKDSAGRVVRASLRFNVASKPDKTAHMAWPYPNEAQIDLVPDKQTYAPGETATLLVKTPISGRALVTVERDKVLRSFLATLDGNAPSVRIPLETGDAPNVFVSVMLVRGFAESPRKVKMPDYRLGYCQLNVERPECKLIVSVKPDAANYRPAQNVSFNAEIKDGTGAPTADAEVTLYAVDEGVLSLMGYTTPDPFTKFYGVRPLRVQTGLSLPSLLTEDPEQLTFSNKGYLIGGGGDDEGSRVRKNFLACAFWSAELRTDADGKVSANFTAPDSLTRYRVIAVAHTAKNQFGSGESSFEINKPLMLEPAMPRFGNIGDKVKMRAVLHNTRDTAGEAELTVQLDDKAIIVNGDTNQYATKIQIAARSTAAVDFPVEFKQAGEAKWTWRAQMADPQNPGKLCADAVETKLNVGYIAPLLHETLLARVSDAQTNLLAKANPQFLEGAGKFTARIANTRLSELNDAVSHLLHYPYGCVEQTTSSMLPWIIVGDLQKAIPALSLPPNEVDGAIAHGVSRLLEMQTPSGGLSFWPGGCEPMLWASAYGGMALALAQRGQYSVPAAMLDRICEYLSKELRDTAEKNDNYELSDRCLAVYTLALAGHAEPAYHELLFQKRDKLSAENRALLALAILENHGDAAMVEELINPRKPLPPQGELWFGSGTRELAVRLLAWTQHKPNDFAVDTLIEELLHARRRTGDWSTTQENAWSILAIARYAKAVEKGPSVAAATLTYGTDADEFHLDDKTHVFEKEHAIAPSTPVLELRNPDKALLFTQVRMEARPRVAQQPRQDRGYGIARNYSKVNDDGSLTEAKDLRVGDRVLVTLQIEVRQPAHYLAVDDSLPSVFEAINPNFKSQAVRIGERLGAEWFSDFHELREDRALFFCDHVAPGNYTIRYLARVRSAGSVTAPGAKIEEMYHPERFGLTETVPITSAPME